MEVLKEIAFVLRRFHDYRLVIAWLFAIGAIKICKCSEIFSQ